MAAPRQEASIRRLGCLTIGGCDCNVDAPDDDLSAGRRGGRRAGRAGGRHRGRAGGNDRAPLRRAAGARRPHLRTRRSVDADPRDPRGGPAHRPASGRNRLGRLRAAHARRVGEGARGKGPARGSDPRRGHSQTRGAGSWLDTPRGRGCRDDPHAGSGTARAGGRSGVPASGRREPHPSRGRARRGHARRRAHPTDASCLVRSVESVGALGRCVGRLAHPSRRASPPHRLARGGACHRRGASARSGHGSARRGRATRVRL